MNVDLLHQDMYAYDIYSEYLDKVQFYALNSNINSLSIRYYKLNMSQTTGVHEDIGVMTDNPKAKTRVYDIFDFVPVLESQPFSYTSSNDEMNQGLIRKTSGVLTVLALVEPLPYDIFNFYQTGKTNEFFYVTEVNFIQSLKELNIYQLTYETANLTMTSVSNLTIKDHFYYSKEFNKFFDQTLYDEYSNLINNKDNLMNDINLYYSCIETRYKDDDLSEEIIQLINSMLIFLNDKVSLKIQPILNYNVIYQDVDQTIAKTLTLDDCYIPDPDYVPTLEYDPYHNQKLNILAYNVYYIQNIYYKFLNFQLSEASGLTNVENKEVTVDTTNLEFIKEIKDLDGQVIGVIGDTNE